MVVYQRIDGQTNVQINERGSINVGHTWLLNMQVLTYIWFSTRITASALKLINAIEREFPRYTEISDTIICEAAMWLMNKSRGQGNFREQANDAPRKVLKR